MKDEVIEIEGKDSGSTSVVLVGVHGNEVCGVEAIKSIIPDIKIEKGRVIFLVGNPLAVEKNVRYVDADLNRMSKEDKDLSINDKSSYEYERAQFIKKYLDQADVLLDIHASRSKESKSFVIAEHKAKNIVQYLPVDTVVCGFDEVEPGGTDYYMNQNDKVGICVECGYFKDDESTKVAIKVINSFLKAAGHIVDNMKVNDQLVLEAYKLYKTQSDNFKLTKQFSDFEKIKTNQLIGMDDQKEVKSLEESYILFARNRDTVGSEAFLLAKKI